MKRTFVQIFCGLTLFLVLVSPAPAQVEKALQALPEDALGYFVLNRLDQTDEKASDLAKRLGIPLPPGFSPLAIAKLTLGVNQGLDGKGTVAVALMPGNGEPIPLIFIPVTSYADFIGQLKPKDAGGGISEVALAKETFVVGKRMDYAVLAKPGDKAVLAKTLTSAGNQTASSAAVRAWLIENDLGAVMTSKGVKTVAALGRQGLQKAKAGIDQEEIKALVGGFIDSCDSFLKSAETDITHVTLGGRLDAAGNLHMDSRVLFAPASSFARFGASVPAMEGGPLAGLPGGSFAMAGGGAFSEKTFDGLMAFQVEALKLVGKITGQEIPAEQLKKMEQAFAQMGKGIQGMNMIFASGKPGEHMFAGSAFTMQTENAPAYLARYEKGMNELNEVYKALNNPFLKPTEVKKAMVAGRPALEIASDLSVDDPMAKKMIEAMFGPGGKMTMTLVAVDNKTLMMRYTTAAKFSLAKEPHLSNDPGIAKVNAMLPKGAQWAGYVSPRGLTSFAKDMFNGPLKEIIGGQFGKIPEYPQTAPIAAGIKLSGEGLEIHMVVPAAVLDNLAPYIEQIKKLRLDL